MTVSSHPPPRPLSMGHFRPSAVNGFGDGHNSYAWSCAYYENHVYIGTNRNVLAVGMLRGRTAAKMLCYPVPVPPIPQEQKEIVRLAALSQFPQIWRYSLRTKVWDRVYRAPLTRGLADQLVPLGLGFRNMTVFQGRGDPKPALYTIPTCGSLGLAPIVMRTFDGTYWETLGSPDVGDPNVLGYRGAVPFKGRLFITPVGSRGLSGNTAFNVTVLCSDDPAANSWQVSNLDRFDGILTNHGIFDMGASPTHLYAGTINVREGFQIWKTDGEGPPPHRWTKVLDRGADRGIWNQAIGCITWYNGAMYVGTGIQDGGRDLANRIGPSAGEIIRIYPDDTWDLVMGDPRVTRLGFKVPVSGLGPGFDNAFAGYIWRLGVHDGVLYAGTFDSAAYIPFVDPDTWPPAMRRLLDPGLVERFLRMRAGCELWRSSDGDHWAPVTRNGFGNPFNWGIRALLSTPHGFFVGTANPFGPKVAVHGPSGWRYELNPRGGTEIWHGAPEHMGFDPAETVTPERMQVDPWMGDVNVNPYLELASRTQRVANPYEPPPEWEEHSERSNLHRSLVNLAWLRDFPEQAREFAVADVQAEHDWQERRHPARRLAEAPLELVGLSENVQEEVATYFGGPLRNVGYWREEGLAPQRACEQLVAEVLAFLSKEERDDLGRVLVLGPNAEAVVEHVRGLRPAADLTASRGPDAAIKSGQSESGAAAATFDNVLWIEGPFARPGSPAPRQVWRLLKPGGRLIGTDLLGSPFESEDCLRRDTDLAGLLRSRVQDLEQAGFADVRLSDVTRVTWGRFERHSREFFAAKLLLQQLDAERHAQILSALPGGGLVVAACVFVSAVRPRADDLPDGVP